MKRFVFLVLTGVALLRGECHGDFLEVRRPAKLKASPNRDGEMLIALKLSVKLKLIDTRSAAMRLVATSCRNQLSKSTTCPASAG